MEGGLGPRAARAALQSSGVLRGDVSPSPLLPCDPEASISGIWLQNEVVSRLESIDKRLDDQMCSRFGATLGAIEGKLDHLLKKATSSEQLDHFRNTSDSNISVASRKHLRQISSSNDGHHVRQSSNTSINRNYRLVQPLVVNETAIPSNADSGSTLRDSTLTPVVVEAEFERQKSVSSTSIDLTGIQRRSESNTSIHSIWSSARKYKAKLMPVKELPRVLSNRQSQKLGHSRAEAIWAFLDDPESSALAQLYARVAPALILCAVGFSLLQTVDPVIMPLVPAAIVDIVLEACFAVEVVLRFCTCPSRANFLCSAYNVIDVAATAPIFLRAGCGWVLDPAAARDVRQNAVQSVLLCAAPVLRLLKTLRRFQQFRLLLHVFNEVVEALPILIFMQFVTTLSSACLIYLVEPADNIISLPHAMWLSVVTMTTVGYGDTVPKNAAGSCVVAVLVVSSVLLMAMPLGIVGQTFQKAWRDRDRILLMDRTRARLTQWGYQASDIPVLFRHFDEDNDDELDLKEFREMMKQMQIGLAENRIVELFETFDTDGSGGIDDMEFVRLLFPAEFHNLYERAPPVAVDDDSSSDGSKTKARPSMMSSADGDGVSVARRPSIVGGLETVATL